MNNSEQTKGALVYLPAGVRLYQWDPHSSLDEQRRVPSRYRETTKPSNVLLVRDGSSAGRFCEVLYAGEQWAVHQQDIYPMRKKE